MNAVHKLGGGYYAVFADKSAQMEVVYRAPSIRHIFDEALYERIAKHFIDWDWSKSFDERVEDAGLHVVVEYDRTCGCYFAGVADVNDDWEEVETDFDSWLLGEAVERMRGDE